MSAVHHDDLIEQLEAAPARLEALVRDLDNAALSARPGADDWSAVEIIAHLRASDDLLVSRLYHALVVENAPFVEVSERRWAEVAGYSELPVAALLRGLAVRQRELVHSLRRLDPADWERAGQHVRRGRQTVRDIATHLAEHEQEHLAQLEAAVSR